MSKKMCKLVKDGCPKDNPKKFIKLIKDAKYFCKKCGCVSNDKECLCKPEKIS